MTAYSGVLWVWNKWGEIKDGASIQELISYSKLYVLEINFWGSRFLHQYVGSLHWRQLSKYKFIVGQISEPLPDSSKTVCLRAPNFPFSIPESTLGLHLSRCTRITEVTTSASLKICSMKSCDKIDCIIDFDKNNLTMLERMNQCNLPRLKKICSKDVKRDTLKILRIINMEACHELKSTSLPRNENFRRNNHPQLLQYERLD